MLKLPTSLIFPRLIPEGSTQFDQFSNRRNASVRLFSLDWDGADAIKEIRWKEQFETSDLPIKFCGTFPEQFKDWIDGKLFAITEEYLEEIRDACFKAATEWDPNQNKMINLFGIRPAISYVQTAFHLLADCLYDPETKYYSRDAVKALMPFALTFRFWAHQVSYDKVSEYSGLKDSKDVLSTINPEWTAGNVIEAMEGFIPVLKDNQYDKKKEPTRISDSDLMLDLISGKKSSIKLTRDLHVNIPEIGNLLLLSPALKKYPNKINLTAEFRGANINKTLQALGEHIIPFSFYINTISYRFLIPEATVILSSGTPPPMIVLNFDRILKEDRFGVPQPKIQDTDKYGDCINKVGTVDQTRIVAAWTAELKEKGITDPTYMFDHTKPIPLGNPDGQSSGSR